MAIFVLTTISLSDCGGEPPQLSIWPQIGHAVEAVDYIESLTCDIFAWHETEKPDILVTYDTRECGRCGAQPGHISIVPPECGSYIYDTFGLGLAVHELIHVLGHWWHDEHVAGLPHSVMEPWVHTVWEITQDDIDFIKSEHCPEGK